MIVHVYNPEQLCKSTNKSTTLSNSSVQNYKPPPSPRLLRNSTSKIINTLANKLTEKTNGSCSAPPALVKATAPKNLQMNQDSDLPSWAAPRSAAPAAPPQHQQQDVHPTCTCRCNPPAELNSSAATSHYFTPSSSFQSQCEEVEASNNQADSLEFIPLKKSPSPGRKLENNFNLGRILSPRTGRKILTSSPNPALREKSMSPITSPTLEASLADKYYKLSNSMSNASIQSNFSEDSLQACKTPGCCPSCNPAGVRNHPPAPVVQCCAHCGFHNHRWNENLHEPSHLPSPTWNVHMGVSATPLLNSAVSHPPTGYRSLPASAFPGSPTKRDSVNDFSKDSLNTSSVAGNSSSIVSPVREEEPDYPEAADSRAAADQAGGTEEDHSSAAAAKLEPLAFTIDFGGPSKARKETPRRFVDRLSSAPAAATNHKRNPSQSRNEDRKAEPVVDVIVDVHQGTASTPASVSGDKMLKSLSRMADPTAPVTTPFSKYNHVDDAVDSGRRVGSSLAKRAEGKKINSTSRQSSLTRSTVEQRVKSTGSAGSSRHRRSPSPPLPVTPSKEEVQLETDERDDVSETGTYTIDKDSPSPDEEQSRRDIDRVFGILNQNGSVVGPAAKESETHNVSQNWIQEWAAQVVHQQEMSQSNPQSSSKPPAGPIPRPASDSQRPRRRLPSVPPSLNSSTRSRSSPRPSEMSDPSDSSLETESYLRDTESVVSAMQARMDGRSSTESDVEVRSNIGRKLSAQLRAKIRSLDESYTSSSSSGRHLLREASYVVEAPSVIHNELRTDDTKSINSDSSSDIVSGETNGARPPARNAQEEARSAAPTIRYNRALSLRRGRLGLDTESSPTPNRSKERRQVNISPSRGTSPQVKSPAQATNPQRKLSTPMSPSPAPAPKAQAPPSAGGFSRNDGGRFSLRIGAKAASNPSTPNNIAVAARLKGSKQNQPAMNNSAVNQKTPARSNSTLSSKEAEFQNWKRRKNYDPMKAAAEGRKKEAARRAVTTLTMSQSMIGPVTSQDTPSSESPSPPPRTIIRSASFTCVNNDHFAGQPRTPDVANYSSVSKATGRHILPQQHSVLYSSEEESDVPLSHKRPSPSPPRKYFGHQMNSLPSPGPSSGDFNEMNQFTSTDVDLTLSPGSPRRKMYMDEGLLLRSSASNSSLRARTKLEALDNLVISTIHGLSGKIRLNAEGLLRKLRSQYVDDVERQNLLEDTLNRLAEAGADSPGGMVPNGRSNSRELAGTLKIMKRVEQVFQVLDQVLFDDSLEGGGEESVILGDGVASEVDDWNTYTSGEFY